MAKAKAKTFKNFINGAWVNSVSGKTFENRNPANTSDIVGRFQDSIEADVTKAVKAAREAYPKWRLTPAPKRAEILYAAGEELIKQKESIAQEMTREMGKVLKETRGDVQEVIDMTYFMAGEGRRMFGATTPSELMNKFNMTIRQPIGVVGMITPWNFPIAIPSWKIMPALICGNTAIIKSAPDTPWSVWKLVEILHEAGLPKGVLNMISGGGPEAGQPLVEDRDVDIVSFTGSTRTGRLISEMCAPTFKHCSLEMGGKNVIIVMDDADLELAVEGAVWAAFGTTGQRCTAASRLVVHKSVIKKFTQMLVEKANKLRVGNGLDSKIDMGPVINEPQMKKILDYIKIGQKEGAGMLCGGKRLNGPKHKNGYFIAPTVFDNVTEKMTIFKEEIFGPVTAVTECKDLTDAIRIANNTTYGLSASMYTKNVNSAFTAMRDVYTGIFYVNAPTIGAEVHLPFGGTNNTGNGHREAGQQALDIFSEWKSIYVDYSGVIQKAQIDD
ncbi:MAG: aldehyde dehydrogenase family protein [Candidatus Zixiibacteriota bacterium]